MYPNNATKATKMMYTKLITPDVFLFILKKGLFKFLKLNRIGYLST
mgnify:FL=1